MARQFSVDIDDASREGRDYTGRQRWVYQELRDRKVALFLDKLPQGVWEIRYEMRAEVPGTFHALPEKSCGLLMMPLPLPASAVPVPPRTSNPIAATVTPAAVNSLPRYVISIVLSP